MAVPSLFATGLPKRREFSTICIPVAFTDTTAVIKATLPKGAIIAGLYIYGTAGSGAVTSAVVSVGTTVTATELINAYDVKTVGTAVGYFTAGTKAGGMFTKLTTDTPVYVKYTGVGGGDSGTWTVKINFFVTGPGETL